MGKGFSAKQKAFIFAYSRPPYPSMGEAYRQVYRVRHAHPEKSALRLLGANGGAVRREVERVRREAEEWALLDLNLSAARVLQEIARIAFDDSKPSERLKALELLAKRLGLFAPEKHDVTSGGKPLTECSDQELLRDALAIVDAARKRESGGHGTPDEG